MKNALSKQVIVGEGQSVWGLWCVGFAVCGSRCVQGSGCEEVALCRGCSVRGYGVLGLWFVGLWCIWMALGAAVHVGY